jgi:signal peptidase I
LQVVDFTGTIQDIMAKLLGGGLGKTPDLDRTGVPVREDEMELEEKDLGDSPAWLRVWRSQRENIQILVMALALALLIRTFVAEPRYIPSDSMLPTLQVGDRLVVEKISYHYRPPAAGDIVVFYPPQQLQKYLQFQGLTQKQALGQVFIKRIIGSAGQTVGVNNGQVWLNGEPQQEDYIAEPPDYNWGPATVPENQFFVMGDNRNNSNDSHIWGFLGKERIIGRAAFRFWPPNRIGPV